MFPDEVTLFFVVLPATSATPFTGENKEMIIMIKHLTSRKKKVARCGMDVYGMRIRGDVLVTGWAYVTCKDCLKKKLWR